MILYFAVFVEIFFDGFMVLDEYKIILSCVMR